MKLKRLSNLSATLVLLGVVCVLPSTSPARAATSDSNAVRDWNATAVQAIGAAKLGPVPALRGMAMMHVAIYDAIQAISTASSRGFTTPYTVAGAKFYGGYPDASQEAATAAAGRTVLLSLLPAQRSAIDAAYSASLASLPDTAAREEGVFIGNWAASQILRWRAGDGSNRVVSYNQAANPGTFEPTGGATPVFTHLPDVTPFMGQGNTQFRPVAPPTLDSAQYAADYNEVKSLGAIDSTTRTADQTQAALFWFDDDYYNWNTVARIIAGQEQTTLSQDARLFAELNVAMYDGLIAIFDAKYTYNFWRPEAAIHAGNSDGNPATVGDPTWTPLKPTPAHPDYPSAHTSSGSAASTVLASFFGNDAISFSFATRTSPGSVTRSYTSLSQAAQEEGSSRIWVGYHFRTAVNVALVMGKEAGTWTVDHFGTVIPAATGS